MRKKFLLLITLASVTVLMLAQAPSPQDKAVKRPVPAVAPAPAAGVSWTTPVNVSNTGTRSQMPVGAADAQGKAYVIWTEYPGDSYTGPRNIAFTTNRTGSWEEASLVTPINYDAIDDVGFPSLAVTPEGFLHFAYHDGDFANGVMAIFYKKYGGGIWGSMENLVVPGGSCSYVNLAVSPVDNYLYAANMMDREVQFDLVLRWRNPGTGSWQGDIIPMTPTAKYMPYLTVDSKGTLHLVYISRMWGDSSIYYAKNPNPRNFNTWTAPLTLAGATGSDWNNPRIAADDNGDVYVVWQDVSSGMGEILLRRTINGAWLPAENISKTPDYSETPAIAVDPVTKEIYIAWQELVAGSNWEVYMRQYEEETPGGQKKWSDIINFSKSPLHSGEPWLVTDPKRNIHFFYMDTVGGNREVMYSFKQGPASNALTLTSPNGGESWQAGTTHNITWTTQEATVANVKIELSTNGGTSNSTIIASAPNNGSYAWTVPNTPSANCLVKISDAANAGISNVSDSAFTITPPPSPPLSPAIDTRLNADETKKINKITWAANPLNAAIPLKNYKIYRKPIGAADSSFVVISSASSSVLQYEDSNLDIVTKYAYRLTSLSTFDVESEPSSTVTESRKFEFPPLNAALQTTVNRILFYREKNNTISFEKNAFNDDNDVNGYRIYRKKATDDDDQFVAIKTLDSSTFSYKDARLPVNPKYAYAVTTVYKDGRESRKSATVTEK